MKKRFIIPGSNPTKRPTAKRNWHGKNPDMDDARLTAAADKRARRAAKRSVTV